MYSQAPENLAHYDVSQVRVKRPPKRFNHNVVGTRVLTVRKQENAGSCYLS